MYLQYKIFIVLYRALIFEAINFANFMDFGACTKFISSKIIRNFIACKFICIVNSAVVPMLFRENNFRKLPFLPIREICSPKKRRPMVIS